MGWVEAPTGATALKRSQRPSSATRGGTTPAATKDLREKGGDPGARASLRVRRMYAPSFLRASMSAGNLWGGGGRRADWVRQGG